MTNPVGKSDVGRLLEMINGYQTTCVLVAALQVGLFDALRDREMTENDLAETLGAHASSLTRLARALEVIGVIERRKEQGDATTHGRTIALTRSGRLFQGGSFGLRDWTALVGGEYLAAWGNLKHAVMTGDNAFENTFGMKAWEHREEHPKLNESFNRVTAGVQSRTINALLSAYDFTGKQCIVDVGGGHGKLVGGVLAQYPETQGIVFDLPHVVEGAGAIVREAGIHERCRIEGGSFLETVPSGGDVYLLKHVLHNWQDAECIAILKRCREAMEAVSGALLLVLENVMPDEVSAAAAEPAAAEFANLVMLDLHMMAMHGGRERTVREFEALFSAAGLRLTRVISTRGGAPDIVEAMAAAPTSASRGE
jgi:hypothetical protein